MTLGNIILDKEPSIIGEELLLDQPYELIMDDFKDYDEI